MQSRVWLWLVLAFLAITVTAGGISGIGAGADGNNDSSGPLADAGLDQTVTEQTTVYLDAGGSTAPDGSIEAYQWTIQTPSGESMEPACETCLQTSFTAAEVGTYDVSVTVTDDEGRTDTDTLYVEVEAYDPPTVSLDGPTSVPVDDEQTYVLDAEAGDESLSTALWQVDDEPHSQDRLHGDSELLEQELVFETPGRQQVNATVVDELGYQSTASLDVLATTEESFFDVTVTDITTPVTEGEPVTVEATVENLGEETGTQQVWLTRGDVVLDLHDPLTLTPGKTTAVELLWQTNIGDAGTHTLEAHSRDTTDDATVTVESTARVLEPQFSIEYITTPPETVIAGELVQPTVEVTNIGRAMGTTPVTLTDIEDNPVETTDVTLAPGQSVTVDDLSWRPEVEDTGSGELTAQTVDDYDDAPLTVTSPFEIHIVAVDSFGPGPQDDAFVPAQISLFVHNSGTVEDTQTVELWAEEWPDFLDYYISEIDGEPWQMHEQELTLGPNEYQYIDLENQLLAQLLSQCEDGGPSCAPGANVLYDAVLNATVETHTQPAGVNYDRTFVEATDMSLDIPPEQHAAQLDAAIDLSDGVVEFAVVSPDGENIEDFDIDDVSGHGAITVETTDGTTERVTVNQDGSFQYDPENIREVQSSCFYFRDGFGDTRGTLDEDEYPNGHDSIPRFAENHTPCDID